MGKMLEITSWESAKREFRRYAEGFLSGHEAEDAGVTLKIDHTFRVVDETERLAAAEGFSPEELRLCRYAALFHDLSRFEQFVVYKTFRDAESFDHGDRSAELAAELGFLAPLPADEAEAVLAAIRRHNKIALPDGPMGLSETPSRTVRDADKLDIMEIFLDYLDHPENPAVVFSLRPDEPVSPEVLAALRERRSPNHAVMRSVSDFTAAKLVWAFDLNYRHSRREFLRRSYFERLMEHLPEQPELEELHRTAVDFLAKA